MKKYKSKLSICLALIFFIGLVPFNSANEKVSAEENKKITMGWQPITTKASNKKFIEDYLTKKSSDKGLDVIAPTWFYLDGSMDKPSSIDVKERADKDYVTEAHNNGYKVWALFGDCNREEGDMKNHIERAAKVFSDNKVKEKVINKLADYAVEYNLDGINVNFEGLGIANKPGFTEFIRDLSKKLHEKNMVVSVNVTPVENAPIYNFYDRTELSKYADYIVLMAYDEHYGGFQDVVSKGSVSVAGYFWVREAIEKTIEEVPKEKLILGIPFYMRSFRLIDQDQNAEGFYKVYGEEKELYSEDIDKLYKENEGISCEYKTCKYYDDGLKQNVLQYPTVDNSTKKYIHNLVYIEDDASIKWRADFINEYDLSGLSAWRLFDKDDEFWSVIKNELK